MAEAAGIAVVPIYKRLSNPADAPKPFMIAMATAEGTGGTCLHYFMDRSDLEKFARDILSLIFDG